ncbi:thiamine pyrophosphokinase 1 isoform X4 [Lampetra fluviatilis]
MKSAHVLVRDGFLYRMTTRDGGGLNPEVNFSRLLLNMIICRLCPTHHVFFSAGPSAVIRACADGGANALYKCMGNSRDRFIPDFISGDFDSIEKAVEEYYKEKGSDFIKTPDQDHTDFTKALQLLLQRARDHNTKIDMVVTLGGLSGRFDQILASVNTLYHARPLTNLPVYVIHGSSLICLLREYNPCGQGSTGVVVWPHSGGRTMPPRHHLRPQVEPERRSAEIWYACEHVKQDG